ncbi:MAG: class I SAM-dependent methyltransferase [Gallionella sp.]|jgi:SAM-dependent MidA family methyltransferase|nr:class I SAM-dependent methyltransferase [Gallionella sp.]
MSLPVPDSAALQHSAQLSEHIRAEIAANDGWISFTRYMELALYAPGLGYYTAGAHKFGEAGDFITAPELSPLFGRSLARQLVEIMRASQPTMLELGAGSGKLAADILAELELLGQLPEQYSILEVSADLRERQRLLLEQRVPHLLSRVQWLDRLPDVIDGVVFGNEILDALPVHLLHWRAGEARERGVAVNEAGFCWQDRPLADDVLSQAAQRIQAPDDYLSEICPAARGLINSLAQRLQSGVLLFIDYGFGAREFYHPQRSRGTLMCHYRHHAHDDPFYLPGLQDITAHVDFTAVAEAGIDAGLEFLGYTHQAFFLMNCGITEFLQNADPEDMRAYAPLAAQLQKLTSPAEMGELFKVIALGKNMEAPLRGFALGDLSRTL